MKWKPDGVSRAGKPYKGFWTCGKKNPDGTWCDYKPAKPATNTAKFNEGMAADDSMNAQSKKDALITRTALAKSFIEAGRKYDVETIKEYHRWLALVEGRAVSIEPKAPGQIGIGEEEIDVQSIPF
jgi:hypothetical protein